MHHNSSKMQDETINYVLDNLLWYKRNQWPM